MKNFRLTLEAEADLLEIIGRILDESPDAARRVRNEFEAAFTKLGDHPGLGHFREELLDQRHKFWSLYSYLMVYRWKESPAQILAVVHGARDLQPLFVRRGMHSHQASTIIES